MVHHTCSAQNSVCSQFGRNDEIEWGQYFQVSDSGLHGGRSRFLHEQGENEFSFEEVEQEQRDGQAPYQFDAGTEACFYTVIFCCTDVLGSLIGNSISKGGEGCDD